VAPDRIAIKVRQKAIRHIKSGHPWLFDQSIVKQNKDGTTGDIAIIFDNKSNGFLAIGLYDAYSPIRVKILSTKNGTKIDNEWIRLKISHAFELRQALLDHEVTGYRLLYGENDGLPGLVCDVYGPCAVIKLYSLIWQPLLNIICDTIIDITKSTSIVLRLSRLIQKQNLPSLSDGLILRGQLKNPEVIFREYGVSYYAHVIHGHKTGFFLDHRQNRRYVQSIAKRKTVLDVFTYAGGFAIHAAVGGAKSVTAIDISKPALALAQKNAELNKVKIDTIAGDAFKIMQQLTLEKKKYDLIIIDPPAFAKSQKEVPKALEQYARLALLGIQLTAEKGTLILASCSSRVIHEDFFRTVESAMSRSRKTYNKLKKTGHDIDHPIGFSEGSYLKSGYYEVATY